MIKQPLFPLQAPGGVGLLPVRTHARRPEMPALRHSHTDQRLMSPAICKKSLAARANAGPDIPGRRCIRPGGAFFLPAGTHAAHPAFRTSNASMITRLRQEVPRCLFSVCSAPRRRLLSLMHMPPEDGHPSPCKYGQIIPNYEKYTCAGEDGISLAMREP